MTTAHPKAYTVEENILDPKKQWIYFDRDGDSRYGGDSRKEAEEKAAQVKQWDDFNDWKSISHNLSDENFIKGSRKYDKLIRQTVWLQNWLRDELLMRLILKNS